MLVSNDSKMSTSTRNCKKMAHPNTFDPPPHPAANKSSLNHLRFTQYKDTEFEDSEYEDTEFKPEIPEETLSVAMERPYGPQIKLDFDFKACSSRFVSHAAFIRANLLKYKNSISGLAIPLCHDSYAHLLQETFYLKHLEQLDISLSSCNDGEEPFSDCELNHLNLEMQACISFIALYAYKLKHLGIHGMDSWEEAIILFGQYEDYEIDGSNLAYLPNLNSLALSDFAYHCPSFVTNKVNVENITNLKLTNGSPHDDFDFGNLSVLSVVDDITYNLQLSVALLKKNSKTLTKLEIGAHRCYNDGNDINFNDIKFSKLRYLKIQEMSETAALSLIQNATDTLEELCICDNLEENLESGIEFQLPHVKKINFKVDISKVSSKLIYSLINACNENTIFLLNDENICKPMIEYLRNKW